MDRHASELLKERRHSVEVDHDTLEGMLSEMQTEMENLTRLANLKVGDVLCNASNDAGMLFSDWEQRYQDIANMLTDLSYITDDTLEIAIGKLKKIQVTFTFNVSSIHQ